MKTNIYLYLFIMIKKLRFTRARVASYLTRLQALVIKSYESTDNFDFRQSVVMVLDDFQLYMDMTGKHLISQLCIEDVFSVDAGRVRAVGTESLTGDVESNL